MTSVVHRSETIRFRITALATVAVAVVLTIAAVALIMLVRIELFTNLDSSLEQRADTYESSFASAAGAEVSLLLNSNDEDRAAQLVDQRTGDVIASTPNLVGVAPLLPPQATTSSSVRSTDVEGLEDDAFRVLSTPVAYASGPAVLHVVQNIDDLHDTIRYLSIALLVTVPAVVTLLAALVWWLVGRTLHPVEMIRTEVADISGTDLTRRVPVPEHLDEISRLAATMNEMLDRIDAASRRQRQFVADASHELRTPLTRIRTELEVDRNRPSLATPEATNATVLEETIGLQHLLDNLLFLARSDERQLPSFHRRIDLDDVVLREVTTLRPGAALAIDTTGVSAADMSGDRDQLARMVRNLLTNALRHARSRVVLELSATVDLITLSVSDDGPGIPAEARQRIFERFGRTDDARARVGGGAGLGLAIVQDIVERHDGHIRYEQWLSRGARFVVEFPVDGSS